MESKKKNFEKELRNKIQQKLKGRETEESFLIKTFKFMDIAGCGKVNFDKFSGAIARMGFAVDSSSLEELFKEYDTNQDKWIDYKEFSALLLGKKATDDKSTVPLNDRGKALIETLKKKVNERGTKGVLSLVKCFKQGGIDKPNNVTLDEFKQSLRSYKLGFDDADLETIFRLFDEDHDSLVDVNQFMKSVKGELNETRLDLVNVAFSVLDSAEAGKVDIAQIRSKYNPSKHPAVLEGRKTEKQILEEFTSTFDMFVSVFGIGKLDGTMTRDDFVEYYAYISGSIDNDEYFKVMIQNSWNLEATAPDSIARVPDKSPALASKPGLMTFGGESGESPFKKTISESSATDKPLVKTIQTVAVEAPYYTEEEQKKLGNVSSEKMLQKTDNLVLERYRTAVLSRGILGIMGVERQFKMYAKGGPLDFDNFKQAIEDFHLSVDPKDLSVLFKAMDTDMDEKVAYEEFVRSVVGELNPHRAQCIELAFKTIDKDGDGKISKSDISRAMDGLKHPDVKQGKKTQEELLHEILDLLDMCTALHKATPAEGCFDKEDFQTYYKYISACMESDAQFEQLMAHLWRIDAPPKLPLDKQPYAGSSQKVFELSGKDTYIKDLHGSMKNDEHPMKGSNKFEWDVPPYTVFDRVEEEKAQSAAGFSSYHDYKKKEEDSTAQEDMTNTEILEYIKGVLAKRGVMALISLNRLLNRTDRGKTGKLAKDSFEDCLKQMGVKLIPRNLEKLFKLFDVDNSGVISHQEFVKTIVGEMNGARIQLVEKAFRKLDRDKNGYIDSTDIIALYDASKHPEVLAKKRSSKEILAQFLDTVELHMAVVKAGQKDQRITMEDFKGYYDFFSCAVERDDVFEKIMNEVWKMEQGPPHI